MTKLVFLASFRFIIKKGIIMTYAFYKVIHIVSIVLFFVLYMSASLKSKQSIKKEIIFTGVALLLILVSGFGLVAKIGIAHGSSWPYWIMLKLMIWAVIGMSGHIVLKRYFEKSGKVFWIFMLLLLLASYLANYKPF